MNDKAVEDFSTILEILNPRYVDAYNNRAFSYNCMQEWEKAVQDCESAIKIKPKLAEARRIRSYAYLQMGKYEEAIEEASHAIELFGSFYAKAFYTRGLAFERLAAQTEDEKAKGEFLERGQSEKEVAEKFCPNVADSL
jgi:tetratricopeptide (TPR) repeat protein